jgi:hypothetical protein
MMQADSHDPRIRFCYFLLLLSHGQVITDTPFGAKQCSCRGLMGVTWFSTNLITPFRARLVMQSGINHRHIYILISDRALKITLG